MTEALPDLPSFADGRGLAGWKGGSWQLYFQLRCCWAGWQVCLEVDPSSAWHERRDGGGYVGVTGQVDDELDKVAKEVANTHSSNFG